MITKLTPKSKRENLAHPGGFDLLSSQMRVSRKLHYGVVKHKTLLHTGTHTLAVRGSRMQLSTLTPSVSCCFSRLSTTCTTSGLSVKLQLLTELLNFILKPSHWPLPCRAQTEEIPFT